MNQTLIIKSLQTYASPGHRSCFWLWGKKRNSSFKHLGKPGLIVNLALENFMKLDRYSFIKKPAPGQYEFYSEGPKGRIRKIVEYYKYEDLKDEVFNLSFGDWNSELKRIVDIVNSNNSDRDKILRTVAATLLDFIKDNPNAIIIATGSTPSRNRLYQMNIGKIIDEIKQKFEVQGYTDIYCWEPFRKGINYNAFLL